MRRTGTSHAPRAIPMSIHKIEIGIKPFPNFPICSKETPVPPRLFQYTLPQQYSVNFLTDYSFSAAMMVSMISAFLALDSMAMPFSCA